MGNYFIRIVLYVAISYFAAAYYAVSALTPDFAFEIALVVTIAALATFQFLVYRFGDQPNMLFALLLTMPVSIVFAGTIWWAMRWFDFWLFNSAGR